MNAIEINALSKSFGDFTLDNINLELPQGCIMGLVGENGAGKSTTIKLLLDVLRADSGSVKLLGQESVGNTALKEDVGVVPDEVGVPDCLTVLQFGKVLSLSYKNWQQQEYLRLVNVLDLPLNKPFKEFSKGMKMKLGIAAAMSHGAKLLILDEATAGLDPVARDQVVDMLMDFTRDEEHSVLISSHIVSDLEKLCDYIAFIHKGKLMLCEEKDRLKEQYGLVRCSEKQLESIPGEALRYKKSSPYGVEALVLRHELPAGLEVSHIGIEELFVFMAKGVN